jgi:PPOX class probable F420-dependent enzyme
MERVADLGRERYISITTFRRDESPVATPVWVVADSGRLYVWTGAQTGKAKRISRNPPVTVAPCTARGTPTGPAVPAQAQIVPSASRPQVWPLFLAKYGIQLRATVLYGRISGLLRRGRPPAERIFLELTLTDGPTDR